GWHMAVLLTVLAGMGFVGAMIRLGTIILQDTPDDYRGRVTSLQQVCFRAGQPLGAIAAGAMARTLGVRTSFAIFGVALVVVGVTVGWSSHQHSAPSPTDERCGEEV